MSSRYQSRNNYNGSRSSSSPSPRWNNGKSFTQLLQDKIKELEDEKAQKQFEELQKQVETLKRKQIKLKKRTRKDSDSSASSSSDDDNQEEPDAKTPKKTKSSKKTKKSKKDGPDNFVTTLTNALALSNQSKQKEPSLSPLKQQLQETQTEIAKMSKMLSKIAPAARIRRVTFDNPQAADNDQEEGQYATNMQHPQIRDLHSDYSTLTQDPNAKQTVSMIYKSINSSFHNQKNGARALQHYCDYLGCPLAATNTAQKQALTAYLFLSDMKLDKNLVKTAFDAVNKACPPSLYSCPHQPAIIFHTLP